MLIGTINHSIASILFVPEFYSLPFPRLLSRKPTHGGINFFPFNGHNYEQKQSLRVNRTMVISPMIEPLALKVAGEPGIETYSYADGVTL